MSTDPDLLQAIERAVVNDPSNRALRLHLVELLLADQQHAAALGHCEVLARAYPQDPEVADRKTAARSGLGLESTTPKRSPAPVDDREADDPRSFRVPRVEDLAEIVRPDVTLADVAGMDEVKQRLQTGFLEPLRNPDLRATFGQSLGSSLLLWGPPGCGKTFIARALAGELGLFFVHVGIADVLDLWVGSSERNIRALFEEARRTSPSVLFLDELDALGHRRSRLTSSATRNVVNQLLLELDGTTSDNDGVLVLGATNQPWDLDPALLRPGRFDRQVVVLPPDATARRAILANHLRTSPLGPVDLHAIADRTDGYSGADLARIARRAVEFALHDSVTAGAVRPVSQGDLEQALADTPASTEPWMRVAENYLQFSDDDGQYDDLRQHLADHHRRGRRRR